MMRRIRLLAIVVGLLLSVGGAVTAANTVASSRSGFAKRAGPTANDLKPAACAALNLTKITVVNGGGNNENQLILGTTANDNINGGNGNDCLVGGAGSDRLNAGAGTDVCIGGPGNDTFHQSCETQIQ
jgi:Ca2+-binding RTX toxin-like protein